MNGIDYTKALNDKNRTYRDSIKNIQDSHKRELDTIDRSNEARIKKLKENYAEGKSEIEDNSRNNLSTVRKSTQETLREKAKDFVLKRFVNYELNMMIISVLILVLCCSVFLFMCRVVH